MPERIREILDKILEWWKKFNNKQRITLISITAVVLIALIILGVVISRPNMVKLIACSDSAQASEVKELLDSDTSINYAIDENMVVTVDSADLVTAEMLLGQNKIPSAGYSIENVTTGGLSTTESDKDKLYKDYLEKKFADRISKLDYVKSATVDVTLPDNDGTILSKEEEGTAAINLDLKSDLSEDQAYAIARFVATQLGNKTTTGITIIDTDANVLYSGADSETSTGLASSQLTYKSKQQKMIEKSIEDALTESGVFSKIEIAMNLDMDFDHTETANRQWSYPEGLDHSLINQESIYESTATNGAAAVPGTDSNDGTTYQTQDNEYSEQTISDKDTDYLNDELVTKTISNGGKIKYDSSSISVVATRFIVYDQEVLEDNGTLDDTTWEQFKAEHADTVKVETVDEQLISLIANATGFTSNNITFAIYEQPSFIDKSASGFALTDIFQILLAVLIFALLGFVVFRSVRREKGAEMEPELSVESLLESTAEANEALEDIGYSEKSETRLLIEKFVDENPDAAALLLRNWLNEDWE